MKTVHLQSISFSHLTQSIPVSLVSSGFQIKESKPSNVPTQFSILSDFFSCHYRTRFSKLEIFKSLQWSGDYVYCLL